MIIIKEKTKIKTKKATTKPSCRFPIKTLNNAHLKKTLLQDLCSDRGNYFRKFAALSSKFLSLFLVFFSYFIFLVYILAAATLCREQTTRVQIQIVHLYGVVTSR